MGRLATAILALHACGCAGALAPAHPRTAAPDLAVIAWNLDAGEGNLGGLIHDLTTGVLVRPSASAYLLLLQEVTELPGTVPFHVVAPVRDIGGGRTLGTAIVSTLPLEDARTIPLPRERQPRASVAATMSVAGRRLLAVSVHLENRTSWWHGALLSENARGRQARALLDALPSDMPGVLGGDLNTWLGPTEPAWRALVARFPDLPPDRRHATFRDRLALDHVLFDLPDGWSAERQVLRDRYGSDHHPVMGLLSAAP